MKETGLTGKRRSTTIAATPDDGKSQRKRRRGGPRPRKGIIATTENMKVLVQEPSLLAVGIQEFPPTKPEPQVSVTGRGN